MLKYIILKQKVLLLGAGFEPALPTGSGHISATALDHSAIQARYKACAKLSYWLVQGSNL